MHGAMFKAIVTLFELQRSNHRLVRYLSQTQYDGIVRNLLEFCCQVVITGIYLVSVWLILRWQALDRIGNTAINQLQFIITV